MEPVDEPNVQVYLTPKRVFVELQNRINVLLPQMMDYRPMKPHVAWRLSAFVLGQNNSRELSSQNWTAPENKRFPVLYYRITVKPEALAHSTVHLLVGCHQMFEEMHRHVHYTCSC